MRKDKIDVIIPAFKAHNTMMRCLSSIACQTIIDDVSVTIVNDCCPEGDYSKYAEMFSECMDIREIKTEKNGGAGEARQYGIDHTDAEFIAFVDADDMLLKTTALDTLRKAIQEDESYKVASGAFTSQKYTDDPERFSRMMVWVFGKLYRREFIDKYDVRFYGRANEDSGFNRTIYMLCDNEEERIKIVEESLYLYNIREDSITNINGNLYLYDVGVCGAIDNMIHAIEHVRRYKPFSGMLIRETVSMMTYYFFSYTTTTERAPQFSIQLWEYVKKFYHTCYKRIENFVTDEAFNQMYSASYVSALRGYAYHTIIPRMTIFEFMDRLRTEEYDPNLIDEIHKEMENDPLYHEIMMNNIACGVIPGKEVEKSDI